MFDLDQVGQPKARSIRAWVEIFKPVEIVCRVAQINRSNIYYKCALCAHWKKKKKKLSKTHPYRSCWIKTINPAAESTKTCGTCGDGGGSSKDET